MRFVALLILAGTAWGSITNECAVIFRDGSSGPCDMSSVNYGSMYWGGKVQENDQQAMFNVGYSQTLTFTGSPAGTAGYIAMYVYDLFQQVSIQSGNSMGSVVKSNLILNRTWDNSSEFYLPEPDTFIPITYGKPITLTVGASFSVGSYPGETQFFSGGFQLMQINVYDSTRHLLAEFQSPTTEQASMQVPVHAPEPASLGITAVAILAFLGASRRCRRTSHA